MKTTEFLDAVRSRHQLPSDYAAAKMLGLTPQQISKYRNGKDYPGDDAAMKMADVLGIDAGYVLACVHAERSAGGPAGKAWEGIAARLKRAGLAAVAAVMAGFFMGVLPSPVDAAPHVQHGVTVYYVKWLRGLAATIRRLARTFGAPWKSPIGWTSARVTA